MGSRQANFLRPAVTTTLVLALLQTGCVWRRLKGPDLAEIYDRAAQNQHVERNPIIVIPGIMGSKLVDQGGRVVWGTFGGKSANPHRPEGARLVALPMREGARLRELTDEVRPNGVLDRVRVKFLGLPFHLGAYFHILGMLGAGGYRDEELGLAGAVDYGDNHFTCFQFAYDWRRDLSETAADLARFIEEKRAYVRAEREKRYGVSDRQIKFDIVAHSMGGLLTRYYLRYGGEPLPEDGSVPRVTWAGTANVERVVLIGPPNAGSFAALRNLVQGVKLGPTLPRYEPAIVGTMPSAYQILPRGRHGAVVDAAQPDQRYEDTYDPELWEKFGWGLASPDQDRVLQWLLPDVPDAAGRRRVALEHLRKSLARARQFAAAIDTPARPPAGVSLYLVVGDAIPTPAVVAVDGESGTLKVIEKRAGDGSVLRSSALMDERLSGEWSPRLVSPAHWSHVTFMFRGHLDMTKDPAFTDNVLFILLEQ